MKKTLLYAVPFAALLIIPFAAKTADVPPASQPMKDMPAMMGQLPADMQLRMQMLMKAETTRNDPAAMLAMKDTLNLREDQVGKLNAIISDARQKAEAVLDETQKSKTQILGDQPASMMQMHQLMMEKMKSNPKMMTYTCPMHPDVRNAGPGKCPKCGMNLEPMACCPMMQMGGNSSMPAMHHGMEMGGDQTQGAGQAQEKMGAGAVPRGQQ